MLLCSLLLPETEKSWKITGTKQSSMPYHWQRRFNITSPHTASHTGLESYRDFWKESE